MFSVHVELGPCGFGYDRGTDPCELRIGWLSLSWCAGSFLRQVHALRAALMSARKAALEACEMLVHASPSSPPPNPDLECTRREGV